MEKKNNTSMIQNTLVIAVLIFMEVLFFATGVWASINKSFEWMEPAFWLSHLAIIGLVLAVKFRKRA